MSLGPAGRLAGKVVVLTGAAGGLGRTFADRLAREGAKLALADVADASASAAAARRAGAEALALRVDVSSEAQTRRMARSVLARFRRIDVLINNAALLRGLALKTLDRITAAEWDRVMAVNVKGAFLCAKAVVPQMRKQGGGKIVNVSSCAALSGAPYFPHYVASKGALIALTRALARELGPHGITANTLAPGLTLTEATTENPGHVERLPAMAKSRCLQRDELPCDLEGAVAFLCSSDSDFITGQILVVDGGALLR